MFEIHKNSYHNTVYCQLFILNDVEVHTREYSTAHFIILYCNLQVAAHEARYETDRIVAQGDLRRKIGQLLYLENLRKSRGLDSNPDPCPICQTNLGDKVILNYIHS
jgi:hypothetical protein